MRLLNYVLGGIGALLAALMAGFMLYTIFVYIPVKLYSEAQCLKQGYPKTLVSVGLERYCTTLDGAITVKMDPQ